MFYNLPDSSTESVLLVCAAGDGLLKKSLTEAGRLMPDAHTRVLLPSGRAAERLGAETAFGAQENMRAEDVKAQAPAEVCILVISHVTRPAYKELVRACAQKGESLFLFSANGLQPLDLQDAQESIPLVQLPPAAPETSEEDAKTWLFFRPSDQSAQALARQLEKDGKTVVRADSLAAALCALPSCQAAFFDWCLSDSACLARAAEAALRAGLFCAAFLALDQADLAETEETRKGIMHLNASLLPHFGHCYFLKSRPFIVERYRLDPGRCSPLGNIADRSVWNPDRAEKDKNPEEMIIAYHGLFYSWHEAAQFSPVLEKLAKTTKVRLDLYGRVHETVRFGSSSLFPAQEKKTLRALDKLFAMPNVRVHGFTAPEDTARAVGRAHFYLGITAAESLMSRTEMRTGVMEAMAVGTPVLHKPTQATRVFGLEPERDFICVDSLHPAQAADAILAAFDRLYRA